MRLSLVIAAYNVEGYLDACLRSIFTQSYRPKAFEVIIVNDGSTDNTAEVISYWQHKMGKRITSIYQHNQGVAAARNAGLKIAKGEWITFPDADDFFHPDYFSFMFAEMEKPQTRPLLAVVSSMIFYFEDRNSLSNTHALRYRFKQDCVRVNTNEMGEFIQLATNSAWLHRLSIVKHHLSFDSRVSPTFEDAHFLNSLFLLESNRTVSFLRDAIYVYRKRAGKNSAVDSATRKTGWYVNVFEFGMLPLVDLARRTRGSVPIFIQNLLFYNSFWYFHHLIKHPNALEVLSDDQIVRFESFLAKVFDCVQPEVVRSFQFYGIEEFHRAAILGKVLHLKHKIVLLKKLDRYASMVKLEYYMYDENVEKLDVLVGREKLTPQFPKTQKISFLGQHFITKNSFWVAIPEQSEEKASLQISVRSAGEQWLIKGGGQTVGVSVSLETVRELLKFKPRANLTVEQLLARQEVLSNRNRHDAAFVFIDRPDRADDNAEHLYRYVMNLGTGAEIWFVLRKSSVDWDRLELEGFRLLEYGSKEHLAVQFNARFLISAEATNDIFWPAASATFKDLVRYEFVFLQHGVTVNDMSRWFNSLPIDLLVTASQREYESIVRPDGRYEFTNKEVLLTGFPRHDKLLSFSGCVMPDTIAIMPTWRQFLARRLIRRADGCIDLDRNQFFREWHAVLWNPRLKMMADKQGLKIKFIPHRLLCDLVREIALPDHVEFIDPRANVSYQRLIESSRLLVTDYSSLHAEFAYIKKPAVYFQFDKEEVLADEHTWTFGYFDYQEDGFGPVATTSEEVCDSIEIILEGREDSRYAKRREAFFAFRDGRCSERVWTAILERGATTRRL